LRRRGLAAAAFLAALGAWLAAPGPASAHGIVQRADIPIPEVVFAWGSAAVLVISFVILASFWPTPKLEGERWRPIGNRFMQALVSRPVLLVCGLLGVAGLIVTIWTGFAGVQTPAANLAPTFVYVIFWNGLVGISVFFGDVFRAFNPWGAVGKAVAWVSEKAAGQPMPAPMKYPERLGYWPAAAGLFLFSALELVVDDGNLPKNVAIAALIYSAITWVGMTLYGIEAWLGRGEAFSVYFNLFSRISPFERRDGRLGIRPPLAGLARLPVAPGIVAVVVVMIGSVTFDGFKEGPLFTSWTPDLSRFFHDVGFSLKHSLELTNLVGLTGCVLVIGTFYWLGIKGAQSVGGGFSAVKLGRSFAHTLVPIALAYVGAHYLTQLLFQGQAFAFLASDPLGHGWNLFGTSDATIDYGLIGATATWYWQVAFVVVGHVGGLTLAHDRALTLYDKARLAVRSQYWMLGVMVGFTCLALWLLSQANT
jgi:hypothetical protein